jgi:hypothetical protein
MTLAASATWTLTRTRDDAAQTCAPRPVTLACMAYLPSLYKARGVPVKSPICAICLDRTRGTTLERQLTHGVRIWLCQGHHSVEFLRRNAGRDFVVTLQRTWRAHGCLTRARNRALDAHLHAIQATGRTPARPRPGSYAWPRLRREAEACFARGDHVLSTITRLRSRHADGHATVPSIRTMRRWFSQGRWLRLLIARCQGAIDSPCR